MTSKITIIEQFGFHQSTVVALSIETLNSFPLIVGCSVKSASGEITDIPARLLLHSGTVLWGGVTAPDNCKMDQKDRSPYWQGQIMFALWQDETFTTRLADTGWVDWRAPYLIGASMVSIDWATDSIIEKYGKNWLDAWHISA